MSDDVTNPLYGKFDEVVEALVKPRTPPEEGVENSAVREDSPNYAKKKGWKRRRKK